MRELLSVWGYELLGIVGLLLPIGLVWYGVSELRRNRRNRSEGSKQ